jgi:hypothetical protein
MKKRSLWSLPGAVLSAIAIAGSSMQPAAIASPNPSPLTERSQTSVQLAQAPESFCRRVLASVGLIVRAEPTPNSPRVGGVGFDTQVTLAQGYRGIQGPGGRTWIEIVSPVEGYVSNGFPSGESNLGYCTERVGAVPRTPTETTTESLCREVNGDRAPRGLAIRDRPSRLSEYKGGVGAGEQVTLVENYELLPDANGEPRDWVEITFPINGYVSARNLEFCP